MCGKGLQQSPPGVSQVLCSLASSLSRTHHSQHTVCVTDPKRWNPCPSPLPIFLSTCLHDSTPPLRSGLNATYFGKPCPSINPRGTHLLAIPTAFAALWASSHNLHKMGSNSSIRDNHLDKQGPVSTPALLTALRCSADH